MEKKILRQELRQLSREAFRQLYSVADRVRIARDPRISQDWDYLQATNNFRFMGTKPTGIAIDRGIYSSPFDAFTNYMNILGDFINRVNNLYPEEIDNDQLNGLFTTIKNQGDEIEMKNREIERLQTKLRKMQTATAPKTRVGAKAAKTAKSKIVKTKPTADKAGDSTSAG